MNPQATEVAEGTLRAGAADTFSAFSAHGVAKGATLDLAGFDQTLASLTNGGTVALSGATPGTALTVTGAYIGNGGHLALSTQLGGNGSISDKLLLRGAAAVASGSTTIQITNVGGLGAQTTGNGIEIIGTEDGGRIESGAFTLANGHVDAGAYEYRLHQTQQMASLQSSRKDSTDPAYRTEVPLLSALPAQLRQADLAMLGNLRQRVGDETGSVSSADRRTWGRILRADPRIRQQGTVSPRSNGHLDGFQAGLDLYASPGVHAGLYVGELKGRMSVNGLASGIQDKSVGHNSLHGRYLGVYGSWQGDAGMYADAVLQAADYRSSLHGESSSALTKGRGWLASLELGKPFAVSHQWQIEPQVQLIHRRIRLDDTLLSGATVQHTTPGDWALRIGARIKGSLATAAGVFQPYAGINVYRASSTDDIARFITSAESTRIAAKGGTTSTALAAGAALRVSQRTSLYGEFGKHWANGGDTRVGSGLQASLGVKMRW